LVNIKINKINASRVETSLCKNVFQLLVFGTTMVDTKLGDNTGCILSPPGSPLAHWGVKGVKMATESRHNLTKVSHQSP